MFRNHLLFVVVSLIFVGIASSNYTSDNDNPLIPQMVGVYLSVGWKLPTSCTDALLTSDLEGIHPIYLPESDQPPFYVYCIKDPDNGPAWTIIQRRQDGSENFYRGWEDYKRGFGNLNGEHFIGLETLHALTNAYRNELWVQLENFDGEKRYAYYDSFGIDGKNDKYALNVLGEYSGNAGDSLENHRGMKFSTKDAQFDNSNSTNCAVSYTGAWWYNKCYHCNLNGQYLLRNNRTLPIGQGITWNGWKKDDHLKYVHMAIRPTNK